MTSARFIRMEQPAQAGYSDIAPACALYQITHPDGIVQELRQPCEIGLSYYTADRQPVWGWDGDTTRPTLTPSFLHTLHSGVRLHWFLTGGEILQCPDNMAMVWKAAAPSKE